MWGQHLRYNCLWLSVLISTSASFAQTTQDLTVLGEKDEPLIGVHVFNGNDVSVTDLDGKTTIELENSVSIRFEYLGYKEITLSIDELRSTNYICRMIPDDEILEEVIIIGRTDAREIDLPYSVARIKSEEIFSSNAQNSADALSLNSGAYVQKSQLGGRQSYIAWL